LHISEGGTVALTHTYLCTFHGSNKMAPLRTGEDVQAILGFLGYFDASQV
jgi:hypothetical protein